jgi:hypothetical protein
MSALTEFLYPVPAKRTVGGIVKWWEKRRFAYNIAVGAAGLVSLGIGTFFAAIPPLGALVLPPWQAVVGFGVMANVCYGLGPTAEILIEKLWGRQVLPSGPALYRMGLTFSIGLALFPALLMVIIWVARVLSLVF